MTNPIDIKVGAAIRQRRKSCGMTQSALADKIGISFQQLQKYETGFNRVSASRLWYIARALNTEPHLFFPNMDGTPNPHAAQNLGEAMLLKWLRTLPDATLRPLIQAVLSQLPKEKTQ